MSKKMKEERVDVGGSDSHSEQSVIIIYISSSREESYVVAKGKSREPDRSHIVTLFVFPHRSSCRRRAIQTCIMVGGRKVRKNCDSNREEQNGRRVGRERSGNPEPFVKSKLEAGRKRVVRSRRARRHSVATRCRRGEQAI